MKYLLVFLEGIITFISPCILPMLPIYLSYFSGQSINNKKNALVNSIGFVLGFTVVFSILGLFVGALGSMLKTNQVVFNIISGLIIVIFGLNFLEIIKIPFLNKTIRFNNKSSKLNLFSSIIFGIIFAIGWTPCVGAFLGTALTLAAQEGSLFKSSLMLILFSFGLGIPFILSAVLIERLSSTINFFKKHARIISILSGIFLIIIGVLMMSGMLGYYLKLLTF